MDAAFPCPELKFVAPLGRGGTAEVSRAFSHQFGHDVAVKYPLRDGECPECSFIQLARREYELIGDGRYPGLVRLLAAPHENPDYLLLQLCTGPTLDTLGRVDNIAHACNMISAAAVVLEYLNTSELIHGDLKSSNFFLPPDWRMRVEDKLFFLKLSDFSLGRRATEPDSSRLGVGTVGYMAPETIVESRTSTRSDLFALGVIAYQLLSGTHPFIRDEADPVRVSSRVREGDYPNPRQLRPDLPDSLVQLLESLLAVDENARPISGWDVCRQLESLGATYPYRKALAPHHVIPTAASYDAVIESVLDLSSKDRARLDNITGGDVAALRLVLTASFRKRMLRYDSRKFVVTGGLYWPSCLRRYHLARFSAMTWREKRGAVVQAVVSEAQASCNSRTASPSPLHHLLGGLLRPSTTARTALTLADSKSAEKDYHTATLLYIRSGNLVRAAECADQAALALEKSGRQGDAYTVINSVLEYARLTGHEFEIRVLYMTRGDIEKRAGDIEEALQTYSRLVELYDGRQSDKLLAETYKDLGDVYKMKQQTTEGLAALERARAIYEEVGDELEVSHTLNNIGTLHWLRGDWRACKQSFLRALRVQRRLDAGSDIASTLSNLASTYAMEGRHGRAKTLFEHAVQFQQQEGDQAGLARTLNNIGYVLLLVGNPRQAVEKFTESLSINRQIGNKKELLFNLQNLTTAMVASGSLSESLVHLNEGTRLAESMSDLPSQAALQITLGDVFRLLGRFRDSMSSYSLAQSYFAQIDEPENVVRLEIRLAELRLAIGDRQGAQSLAVTALDHARGAKLPFQTLEALLLLQRVDSSDMRRTEIEELCARLHLVREIRLERLNSLEWALSAQGDEQITRIAERMCESEVNDLENGNIEGSRIAMLFGEMHLRSKQTDLAISYLQTALHRASQSGLQPELLEIHTLLGQAYLNSQQYEKSYSESRIALDLARKIISTIDSENDRRLYQQQRFVCRLMEQIKTLGANLGSTSAVSR